MKFFQVVMLIVAVVSAIGAICKSGFDRGGYIALMRMAGALFLISWVMAACA